MTSQQRILICDDDPRLIEAVSLRLENAGFDVITATDGYLAVQTARREQPDLIILDVNMPAGNGFSVHERLRDCADIADTPVVYLTGNSSAQTQANARTLGAFALLYKPFETEMLLDTVRGALGYWSSTTAPTLEFS